MTRRLLIAVLSLAAGLAWPAAARAEGDRYALLVQGASGGEPFTTRHRQWLDGVREALTSRLGFDPSRVTVLAEKPGQGELPANAESVRAAFARLAPAVKADDLLFILLIGHGSADSTSAKFNLVGPDLTAAEWSELATPIAGRLALVDTTASSFPFLQGFAKPGRVVMTATSNASQRYDTVFGGKFVEALTAPATDADKDARLSLLEVFMATVRLVKQHYDQAGTMITEHAVFDDTGEGVGRDAAEPGSAVGTVASLTYLDAAPSVSSADPELQALLERQQALTEQVDDLRRRRPGMTAGAFDAEFERLIIELSLVSREVRRKSG